MTKTELRDSFIAQGFAVQPVAQWTLVSQVEGVVKYDANVADPSFRFYTAQVVVTDDGGPAEDATPLGSLVTPEITFDEAVRTYVLGLEVAPIFAIAITQTFPADEVALATAYNNDGSQANYVIKRRADTFSFVQLV